MFGIYRFFLAILVVAQHFHLPYPGAVGKLSVVAFYILSGYLMTLVLNREYPYTVRGIAGFLINRALRIYPMYLIVLAFTVFFVYFLPSTSWQFWRSIIMPQTTWSWLQNLFLILPGDTPIMLIPQAWSLFVEFCYYILMSIGFSRSKKATAVWFGFSLVYTVFSLVFGLDFFDRHKTVIAGSMEFSIGAMIYHFGERLRAGKYTFVIPITMYLFLVCMYPYTPVDITYYISIYVASIVVITLKDKKATRIDTDIGDLSYPIYLSHTTVGILVTAIFLGVPEFKQYGYFVFYLFYIIVFSYILHTTVDRRVGVLRKRVKASLSRPASDKVRPVPRYQWGHAKLAEEPKVPLHNLPDAAKMTDV
jgi:peptidoglycan/LPS O-acetylase OafA/YrhL